MDTLIKEATAKVNICDSVFDDLDSYILVDTRLEWHRFAAFVNEQNFLGSSGLSTQS